MSEDKFNQAILKIFKLTHLGVIEWVKATVPKSLSQGSDSVFPLYFEAEYQGRKLGLFRERLRRNVVASATMKTVAAYTGEGIKEGLQWVDSDRLVLLDDDGELAYSFPHSRVIRDMLETVRYKTSGVDQFLDELLNTEN